MNVVKSNATDIEKLLDDTLKFYEEGDSIFIALKKNDSIMTAYINADVGTKQEMLGHLQVDIIDQVIKANYVTP